MEVSTQVIVFVIFTFIHIGVYVYYWSDTYHESFLAFILLIANYLWLVYTILIIMF